MRALGVWMNGERVGAWASHTPTHTFDYDPAWVGSAHARPLSLSLPITRSLQVRGPAVENYFDNLLPDNDEIRRRIRQRFRAKTTEAFDLLAEIGRDCVGAVQLLPPDAEPADVRVAEHDRLTEADIEALLRDLTVTPASFGAQATRHGDFRISIAGAQEKTALLWFKGAWWKPRGTTPTTHILKLPLGEVTRYRVDFSTSVENEWVCGRIVHALGLEVAAARMASFGGQRALVVERFDREWVTPAGSKRPYLLRIPQEDLCQATGTPPRLKYENDGGPGMAACLDVLGVSESPYEARLHFSLSQLAFWLLAATDGHAKNFSIFLNRGGSFAPTPLYDVLSAWPAIGKRARQLPYQEAQMAMALRSKNAHYALDDIQARHWRQLAMVTGGLPAWDAMLTMIESVEAALGRVEAELPSDFPAQVWEPIAKGMLRHKKRFLAGAVGL